MTVSGGMTVLIDDQWYGGHPLFLALHTLQQEIVAIYNPLIPVNIYNNGGVAPELMDILCSFISIMVTPYIYHMPPLSQRPGSAIDDPVTA